MTVRGRERLLSRQAKACFAFGFGQERPPQKESSRKTARKGRGAGREECLRSRVSRADDAAQKSTRKDVPWKTARLELDRRASTHKERSEWAGTSSRGTAPDTRQRGGSAAAASRINRRHNRESGGDAERKRRTVRINGRAGRLYASLAMISDHLYCLLRCLVALGPGSEFSVLAACLMPPRPLLRKAVKHDMLLCRISPGERKCLTQTFLLVCLPDLYAAFICLLFAGLLASSPRA